MSAIHFLEKVNLMYTRSKHNGDHILFFWGAPATMNDVIEWFKRSFTISGITTYCMHVYVPQGSLHACVCALEQI